MRAVAMLELWWILLRYRGARMRGHENKANATALRVVVMALGVVTVVIALLGCIRWVPS